MLWSLKESIVKAAGETVWDGLENISLAIDGPRIVWQSARHAEALGWHLTAGTFGRRHILALAVKLSSGWTGRPPVFRTFRYGSDKDQPDGFEPEFRT